MILVQIRYSAGMRKSDAGNLPIKHSVFLRQELRIKSIPADQHCCSAGRVKSLQRHL